MAVPTSGSAGLWATFVLVVAALLALDLGLFQKKPRDPSPKEALAWTALYALLAVVFGAGLTLARGPRAGGEFFTAWLVEQSLSIDNLFVMMIVFASLGVARASQRSVLVWGILGAAALRAVLIFAGTAAIARFHVLAWILGGLLVLLGVKLGLEARRTTDPREAEPPRAAQALVRWVGRVLPISDRMHGDRFVTRVDGVLHATPLLVALVTIEAADVVFALDSVPAVLGVSSDPLVVLTSNVFAILGLRSMYFALTGVLAKLRYLKHGLAAVLVVVGAKMLAAAWVTVPTWLSLVLVASVLGVSVVASLGRANEGKVHDAAGS